jgi:Ca2+-binding EF-hand superfamily protein
MKVDPCRRPTAEEALASAWMLHAAPAASGMTQELIFSLSQYVAAPEIVRCCLFAVAARGRHCVKELQQLRDAFLALDMDGDGFVTKEDMQEALGGIFGFQLTSLLGFVPELDIEALFAAADLDQSGSLGFTEFVAACLYSRYASLDTLIREAFQALDHNGEGIVSMQDIRHLFREQDLRFLSKLPDSRPFTIDEWSSCIQSSERKVWVSSPKAKNKTAKSKAGFLVDLFAPDLFSCREQAGFLADTVVPALFTCKGAWSDEGDYEFITVH